MGKSLLFYWTFVSINILNFIYNILTDDLSTVVPATTATRKASADTTAMELDDSTSPHNHAPGTHHHPAKKGGPAGLSVESCKRQKSLQNAELTRVTGVHNFDAGTAPPPKRLVSTNYLLA